MATSSLRWTGACLAAVLVIAPRFEAQPLQPPIRVPRLTVPLQPLAQQVRRLETTLN